MALDTYHVVVQACVLTNTPTLGERVRSGWSGQPWLPVRDQSPGPATAHPSRMLATEPRLEDSGGQVPSCMRFTDKRRRLGGQWLDPERVVASVLSDAGGHEGLSAETQPTPAHRRERAQRGYERTL